MNVSEVLNTKRLIEEGRISPVEALARLYCDAPVSDEVAHSKGIEQWLVNLESLIGMDEVKHTVREILAFIEVQKWRRDKNLSAESAVLHMIFKGNPGTGKTTVARELGEIFRKSSLLSKGHMIEVSRADLVGEYIGHTAKKTREQVRRALGGILFVDEAYALARGSEKDFGKEAIDTLVKEMEDYRGEFILILAGYHREMEMFLSTNPGLNSRFPITIEFPDYKVKELIAIADLMVTQRQYQLSPAARSHLEQLLTTKKTSNQIKRGNARLVRNVVERSIRKQALRLVKKQEVTTNDLVLLEKEDFR